MLKALQRRLNTLRGHVRALHRGYDHWRDTEWPERPAAPSTENIGTDLRTYFDRHTDGRGIWKFNHYFPIYERHFAKFRGQYAHVLEIGVGGSLEMWRDYFGPQCQIYGVDIEQAVVAYESQGVRIFVGDQADRDFWRSFRQKVPQLDVVIDDGGHEPEQQIVSLEELLPHLRAGGVYLCEDVLSPFNEFASYVCGMAQHLFAADDAQSDPQNNDQRSSYASRALQAQASIHLYPFVTVIEKRLEPLPKLVSRKRGTQWEPDVK